MELVLEGIAEHMYDTRTRVHALNSGYELRNCWIATYKKLRDRAKLKSTTALTWEDKVTDNLGRNNNIDSDCDHEQEKEEPVYHVKTLHEPLMASEDVRTFLESNLMSLIHYIVRLQCSVASANKSR